MPTIKAELKKTCFDYAKEHNLIELPSYEVLEKAIITRDFSEFEPLDDDTEQMKEDKEEALEKAKALFDFYVDQLVPAVAGKTLWHPKVRHFECMSSSKLKSAANQLRITSSTEALTVVMYKNAITKWNAMLKFNKTRKKNQRYPTWNPRRPEENKEWRTPYSSAYSGQSKFGGWNTEGRKYFLDIQKKIIESREQNADRILQVEQESIARLFEQYKDVFGYDEERPSKKKKLNDDDDDDSVAHAAKNEWYFI